MRKICIRKNTYPYWMLLPTFAIIGIFMIYPIINTFYLSMRNHVLTNPMDMGFVGWENFKVLLEDEVFLKSIKNSLVWTVVNVFFQAFFGLIVALLLNQSFRCRSLVRALMFSPWAVGGMLVALIWSFMFNDSIGVVNDLLIKIGAIEQGISWFSTGNNAMWSMVIANTWRGIPFFAVNILSSLQTIPTELYESADVDGAGALRSFFSITAPLIKDTFLLTTLLRTIWTLNVVDIIYSMTRGGPNFSTLTLPVYIMMTFNDSLDAGYSSAMAVLMVAALLLFSIVYLKVSRYGKEEHY